MNESKVDNWFVISRREPISHDLTQKEARPLVEVQ